MKKPSAFEFVVEWRSQDGLEQWATYKTRKEAAAKLREVAAAARERGYYDLRLIEKWCPTWAIDAR